MLDEITFRQLLHESEGTRLDFKREQYKFEGADDSEKSALLKDILTFANSWRSETAYIIIGVTDGEPSSRELVGIEDSAHIDDASLQQFVNSKLNRKITFSYTSFTYEGQIYGVFEIPVQERPFYAKRDFHSVKREVVYYRLGSSCAEATPQDIARMGQDDSERRTSRPRLTVHFADVETRESIGGELQVATICHEQHDPRSLPDHRDPPRAQQLTPGFALEIPQPITRRSAREEFWRELANYLREDRRFSPFLVAVHNPSAVMASTVELELRISARSLEVREGDDFPDFPESHFDMLLLRVRPPMPQTPAHSDELLVHRRGDQWLLKAKFDGIRPRQTQVVRYPVFIGPHNSGPVDIEATCYAAELPEPSRATLAVMAQVEHRPSLTLDDLEQFRFEQAERRLRE